MKINIYRILPRIFEIIITLYPNSPLFFMRYNLHSTLFSLALLILRGQETYQFYLNLSTWNLMQFMYKYLKYIQ